MDRGRQYRRSSASFRSTIHDRRWMGLDPRRTCSSRIDIMNDPTGKPHFVIRHGKSGQLLSTIQPPRSYTHGKQDLSDVLKFDTIEQAQAVASGDERVLVKSAGAVEPGP